jgi:hypothetical protein
MAHRRGGLASRLDHYGTKLRKRAAVPQGGSPVRCRYWAALDLEVYRIVESIRKLPKPDDLALRLYFERLAIH